VREDAGTLMHDESMSREVDDALFLEYEIIALIGWSRERLDDAALELQVDLEMLEYDEVQEKVADSPHDPYSVFMKFLGKVCSVPWNDPHSALAGLSATQLRLVAAWNFLTLTKTIARWNEKESGAWSYAERKMSAACHLEAAQRLVDHSRRTSRLATH